MGAMLIHFRYLIISLVALKWTWPGLFLKYRLTTWTEKVIYEFEVLARNISNPIATVNKTIGVVFPSVNGLDSDDRNVPKFAGTDFGLT